MVRSQRYQVLIDTPARRALDRVPKELQARLIRRIESLAAEPRPAGVVKMSGHDAYRIRVGDYRIIYTIADERLVVLVVNVGHRRDVYRSW